MKKDLVTFFTIMGIAISPILSAEMPVAWGSCRIDWECTFVMDYPSCELVAVNRWKKKEAEEHGNPPGDPRVGMNMFQAACSNHGKNLSQVTTQCSDRRCNVSLDGVTYSERVPLLSGDWLKGFQDKMDLK